MKTSPSLFLVAALVSCTYSALADIVINEIHYNGEPNTAANEFVEIHNTGDSAVDLSNWFFNSGIDYTFPAGTTIAPSGFTVIAERPTSILSEFGVNALGPYEGALAGEGETVELRRADGTIADSVTYGAGFPWPISPSGSGASMELINPSLDNDLAGAWRGSAVPGSLPELTLIPTSAPDWSWRPGDTEASSPIGAWRQEDFVEDATWNIKPMPIGYGGVGDFDFTPAIEGMQGQYTSVFLRRTFDIATGEIPPELLIRFIADDGIVVWINGVEAARDSMPAGADLPATATAENNASERTWLEQTITSARGFLHEGENTIAIQLFNSGPGSSDCGIDFELIRPASGQDLPPVPTPGSINSQLSPVAAPFIRQVSHTPEQPTSTDEVTITAKVTDPDGVASVVLEVQTVAPGAYVPAFLAKNTPTLLSDPNAPLEPNPAYHDATNWTSITMVDDGTGVFSTTLPAEINRTLVRYRITVTDTPGTSARVPYPDDRALNFAYFVYNGVPDYVAETRSINGAPHTYPAETISSIPVYHVITDPDDFDQAVGYNSGDRISRDNYDARSAYNWTCSFVHDGVVYDNVNYRLRQRNARYSGGGKRSFKFRFNRGSYPTFRDLDGKKYPTEWKFLASHRLPGSRGNHWGLEQAVNHILWNLTGTPAPFTHYFHMRVVRGAEEAPSGTNGQYMGDYYGMLLALEEYDKRFIDAHKLENGNLYKLISGRRDGVSVRRYQARDAVDDGSDFTNIIFNLRPDKSDTWLNDHVNYDSWNHYHAIVDAVRHYDVQPNTAEHLKNRAYYFEPSDTNPLGRLNVLPWDSDTSWGPNWGGGEDFCKLAIYGTNGNANRPEFLKEYRNVVREIRDLIWTEEQIDLLIDPLAARIVGIVPADRDRWQNGVGGSQTDPTLESVVTDMKNFAFEGGSWIGGTSPREDISKDSGLSGQQGRDAYLDALAADLQIPNTPTITYTGTAGFPQGGLAFQSSAFSDPGGANSFGAMEWRISEINPADGSVKFEWEAEWESGELTTFNSNITPPAVAVDGGSTYRARVRHMDDTARWSHWSSPVEFTTTSADTTPWSDALVISEIMYHPLNPTAAELAAVPDADEDDFEWIEIMNVGQTTLDLSVIRLADGVEFDFIDGSTQNITPGQRLVIVGNVEAFNARYGHTTTPPFVAGKFSRNLSNGGENLRLAFGESLPIREFIYDDVAPWPTAADGDGFSMILTDPQSVPDHAIPTNWSAGIIQNGTPGSAETTAFNGDPLADDNGNGISNLIEYAAGTSFTAGISEEAGIQYPTISFVRNPRATDAIITIETSTDLKSWITDQQSSTLLSEAPALGGILQTWRSTRPIDSTQQREHLRLRIEIP